MVEKSGDQPLELCLQRFLFSEPHPHPVRPRFEPRSTPEFAVPPHEGCAVAMLTPHESTPVSFVYGGVLGLARESDHFWRGQDHFPELNKLGLISMGLNLKFGTLWTYYQGIRVHQPLLEGAPLQACATLPSRLRVAVRRAETYGYVDTWKARPNGTQRRQGIVFQTESPVSFHLDVQPSP